MANVVLHALVLLGLAAAAAGAPLTAAAAAAAVRSRLLPPAGGGSALPTRSFSAALAAGVAPSVNAPGGLTREQTPQFILFTVRRACLPLPCRAMPARRCST